MGWARAAVIGVGTAATVVVARAVVPGTENQLVVATILLVGPLWATAFCLASDDSDFAGSSRSRGEWLRLLPWTFVLAPLVVPNMLLLAAFFRDARADGGRSPLTWDRMRPGEDRHEHWP